MPAEALVGSRVIKVIWPGAGTAGGPDAAAPSQPSDAPARPAPAVTALQPAEYFAPGSEVATVAAAAVEVDPFETLATLQAERSAARGGLGHLHSESGCGFCRRAVAAYR